MPTTYEELINKGGTIYKGDRGYTNPEELATDLGILPHQIDWTKIKTESAPPAEPPRFPRYISPTETPLGQAEKFLYETTQNPLTGEAEQNIYEQTRTRYQAYIDAINQQYSQLIGQAQQTGKENLGKVRAMGGRGGILGSPMGLAQKQTTEKQTADVVRAYEEERGLKIGEIFSKIDERATERIEAKKKEAIGKAEAYVKYLSSISEKIKSNIKEFAQEEISYDQLDKEDKAEILEQLGWSDFQLENYWNSVMPEPAKFEWSWKGNDLFGIKYDPKTNAIIEKKTYTAKELGIPVGTNIETITDGQGNTYWYDKDNPMDATGKLNAHLVGEKKVEKGTTDYQNWVLAGKPGTFEEFLRGSTDGTNLATTLFNVGLNSTMVDNKGKLTEGNLAKLGKVGIAPADAQALMDMIVKGGTLEEIRQWMKKPENEGGGGLSQDVAYKLLDDFFQTLQGTGGETSAGATGTTNESLSE